MYHIPEDHRLKEFVTMTATQGCTKWHTHYQYNQNHTSLIAVAPGTPSCCSVSTCSFSTSELLCLANRVLKNVAGWRDEAGNGNPSFSLTSSQGVSKVSNSWRRQGKQTSCIWHSEDRASWYILIIKANVMHYFSPLFGKELYMFWTDLLPIIRSLNTAFTATGICHTRYSAVC